MDKTRIHALILATLERDRQIAETVLKATHEAATHSESKAENKYDTRGLEAAYLADGQRRRLEEIEAAIAAYRHLNPAEESGVSIRLGALVRLDTETGERWFFLGPDAAGLKLSHDDQEILVISPRAPLGAALLGREADDEVEILVNGVRRTYGIIELL